MSLEWLTYGLMAEHEVGAPSPNHLFAPAVTSERELWLLEGEPIVASISAWKITAKRANPYGTGDEFVETQRHDLKLVATDRRLIWSSNIFLPVRKKQGSLLGDEFVYGMALGTAVHQVKKMARKATAPKPRALCGQIAYDFLVGLSGKKLEHEASSVLIGVVCEDDTQVNRVVTTILTEDDVSGFVLTVVKAAASWQLVNLRRYSAEPAYKKAELSVRARAQMPERCVKTPADLHRLLGARSLVGTDPIGILHGRVAQANPS